jgi:excisionase family DNA binding protein
MKSAARSDDQFTLTMQAASRFSGLSVRTLQRLIGKGKLKSTIVGRRRLVFKAELIALLEKGT